MLKKLLLGVLVLAAAGGGWYLWSNRPVDLRDSPQGQLPDTATPLSYQIDLTIDPAKDEFAGVVSIETQLNAEANRIWLHGERLRVSSASVTTAAGETFAADYEEVGASGVVELRFNRQLAAQKLTLTFHYEAPFDRTLNGLYLVEDGGEHYAFTQMESHFARKAFPSFDEPRFKVPFAVSLTVRNEHEAIANTPVSASDDLGNGMKKLNFVASKPLPTYLLAWAVGKLRLKGSEPLKD